VANVIKLRIKASVFQPGVGPFQLQLGGKSVECGVLLIANCEFTRNALQLLLVVRPLSLELVDFMFFSLPRDSLIHD